MSNSFKHYLQAGKTIIEEQLEKLLIGNIPSHLYDSMKYSLMAGGKRLRPILLFASYNSFNQNLEKTFRSAVAIEMVHTYSLIHDDLPAMDDDDYRRGHLTNHKKFDEATAILAGDALLTYSFQLISEDPLLTDQEKMFIVNLLAKSSGAEGMVAGQILDIEGEKRKLTLEELEQVHILKTGQLINFSVIAGAYIAGANESQLKYLHEYAYYLGLIFQVQDDILDIIGDAEKLGKPTGSDTENEKSTYPSILGLDGAKKQMELYETKAKEALSKIDLQQQYLYDLLTYFQSRDH